MKNKFCIFVSLVLFFAFLLSFTTFASSENEDKNEIDVDFSSEAKAVYLYSYDADRVIYSFGEDKQLVPASTAKVVTGLIACNELYRSLDDAVVITEDMLDGVTGASMKLEVGMTLTVRDLLYGTICGCNNDAAQALAILCSGSVAAFVEKMNEYADKLYMKSTVFANPTGLDSDKAKTTLSDIANLAKEAVKNEPYMQICSTPSYTFKNTDGIEQTIHNRNALISQFSAKGYVNKNVKGLISGSTDEGGYISVTYAEKDSVRYLCIVMGAEADSARIESYYITNYLLDHVFKYYSSVKVVTAGEICGKLAVTSANQAYIPCTVKEDISVFISDAVDINKDIYIIPYFHADTEKAPIDKDTEVGVLNVYYKGKVVASAALITSENVSASPLLKTLDSMKSFLTSTFFLIFAVIFIPSLAVAVYLYRINNRHKKVGTVRYNRFS